MIMNNHKAPTKRIIKISSILNTFFISPKNVRIWSNVQKKLAISFKLLRILKNVKKYENKTMQLHTNLRSSNNIINIIFCAIQEWMD